MTWTQITDDPATWPVLNEYVFVLTNDGRGCIARRWTIEETDTGWCWAAATGQIWLDNTRWQCDDEDHTEWKIVKWHPLPTAKP